MGKTPQQEEISTFPANCWVVTGRKSGGQKRGRKTTGFMPARRTGLGVGEGPVGQVSIVLGAGENKNLPGCKLGCLKKKKKKTKCTYTWKSPWGQSI